MTYENRDGVIARRAPKKPRLTASDYGRNDFCMEDASPSWQPSEDAPLYTIGTVERAAGITKNNLRVWLHRGHIGLRGGDSPASGRGLPHHFSLRTILLIAVTAELVRCGETASYAFSAAEAWMKHGDIEGELGALASREEGGLYPEGWATFLVLAPAGPDTIGKKRPPPRVRAIQHSPGTALSIPYGAIFAGNGRSATMVWLNWIDRFVRHVCAQDLGTDTRPEDTWESAVQEMIGDSYG